MQRTESSFFNEHDPVLIDMAHVVTDVKKIGKLISVVRYIDCPAFIKTK